MIKKTANLLACLCLVSGLAVFASCGDNTKDSSGSSPQVEVIEDKNHYVGVTYSTWFPPLNDKKWGTPILGEYYSFQPNVINQHAEWLVEYGADFIVIDWTNNIDYVKGTVDNNLQYIESATDALFEVFAARVKEGKPTPKVCIASGIDTADKGSAFIDGRMKRKADQIWNDYYGKEEYKDLIFHYEGKPLLMMYLATEACTAREGKDIFDDERFTCRFFTGYLGEQKKLLIPDTKISKYGYWSWWERGNNAYAVKENGKVECVTISAAWVGYMPDHETSLTDPNSAWLPENGAVGRRNGDTFREQWDLAIQLDAQIVLVQSFNEWTTSTLPGKAAEELDPEYSNDIEPSEELGYLYMEIMRDKAAVLKGEDKCSES